MLFRSLSVSLTPGPAPRDSGEVAGIGCAIGTVAAAAFKAVSGGMFTTARAKQPKNLMPRIAPRPEVERCECESIDSIMRRINGGTCQPDRWPVA